MKKITYTPSALKDLKKAPANIRNRIIAKMELFAEEPTSLKGNLKQLKGTTKVTYRLRVGDWRVIFTEDGEILVIKVSPRGGAY